MEAALSSSQLMDQLQSPTLADPERLELMRRCLAALALCGYFCPRPLEKV